MKKLNNGHLILALFFITLIFILWLTMCQPTPPKPTPTPTKIVPTATFTPTKTEVVITETEVPPTPTFTPTLEPTETPTPEPTEFVLFVHTGYENGWLHFRPGPGKFFTPLWVTGIGAVQEGTKLTFKDCPNVDYPWVHVVYKTHTRYVYGTFLNMNPCP